VTEYDGGFAEWEQVSAERAHAAAVRAAEDQALQRVHETKKLGGAKRREHGLRDDQRRTLRLARSALTAAEERVTELEVRVAALSSALEDPALYARTGGVAEAKRLGQDLDVARRALETALDTWARASASVESLLADEVTQVNALRRKT